MILCVLQNARISEFLDCNLRAPEVSYAPEVNYAPEVQLRAIFLVKTLDAMAGARASRFLSSKMLYLSKRTVFFTGTFALLTQTCRFTRKNTL